MLYVVRCVELYIGAGVYGLKAHSSYFCLPRAIFLPCSTTSIFVVHVTSYPTCHVWLNLFGRIEYVLVGECHCHIFNALPGRSHCIHPLTCHQTTPCVFRGAYRVNTRRAHQGNIFRLRVYGHGVNCRATPGSWRRWTRAGLVTWHGQYLTGWYLRG